MLAVCVTLHVKAGFCRKIVLNLQFGPYKGLICSQFLGQYYLYILARGHWTACKLYKNVNCPIKLLKTGF